MTNKKLVDTLLSLYPSSSRRTLLHWIKNGRIEVDGKVVKKASFEVHQRQKISLKSKEKTLDYGVKIVFQDDYYIIIDKPKNLLSVPLDTPNSINALKILRKEFNSNQIFAVHRIDYETSGLLIFAKTMPSLEKIKSLLKQRLIHREYLAITKKGIKEKKGTLTNYLIEKADLKIYLCEPTEGKIAITHYNVIKETTKNTLLSLKLETGRKHQIRVQLNSIGAPILGDTKYKDNEASPTNRLCLHAYKLSFIHPITKKKMSFIANPPQEMLHLVGGKI